MIDDDAYVVVLYARVSTDDKDQNPETQVSEMKSYCEQMGYVIADKGEAIYRDMQTGKNDARKGLEDLKGRVSRGDIDFILARAQDRISRNLGDYEKFKKQISLMTNKRTRIRFSSNDTKPETYEGTVMDALQASMAQAENLKRSVDTKKGQAQAMREGRHVYRFLSICLDEKLDQERKRVHFKTDVCRRSGKFVKAPTVILTRNEIMDCAKAGMSINRAAKVLNVKKSAFYTFLENEGLKEEYKSFQKGIFPKAVGDLYTNPENPHFTDVSNRGSPSGKTDTAVGKSDSEEGKE